jgi:hypothetical protein
MISAVFGFIGILLFAISGILYYNQLDQIDNSVLVKGVVTGFSLSDDSGTAPVIAYNWDGDTLYFHSQTFSTPPSYAMSEQVDVRLLTGGLS